MVEAAETDGAEEAPDTGKSKGLVIAAIGAVAAGGVGFFVSYAGFLDGVLGGGSAEPEKKVIEKEIDFAFVPLEPLLITLGPEAQSQVLRFTAELEVIEGAEEVVTGLRPRIVDVLNSYLRAVDEKELEDPASLELLRAQMLRRIQIVVGDDLVRDLLVLEFIIN